MEVKPSRGTAGLEIFPLLLVPVVIYNLMALLSGRAGPGGEAPLLATIRSEAIGIPMLSKAHLSLSWGDLLLLLTVALLLVEVIKAARTASPAIINHMLSFGLFIICLVEFIAFQSFASSSFFLITMMVLLDALAGMAVTIMSARRDLDVGGMAAS